MYLSLFSFEGDVVCPCTTCRTRSHNLLKTMEAARHYLEEDVWEEQHETFDEVSDTSEDEQSLDTQDMDAEVETDPNDDESETESCCLQGQPQRLQEHLQLRTSEGTADLNGRGAVHEQLPVGENNLMWFDHTSAMQLLPRLPQRTAQGLWQAVPLDHQQHVRVH
jgi:hypothetical protein